MDTFNEYNNKYMIHEQFIYFFFVKNIYNWKVNLNNGLHLKVGWIGVELQKKFPTKIT